jgi:hypothetical protein
VGRAIDLAAGERLSGPVLLSRSGKRLDRHGANAHRPTRRPKGGHHQAHLTAFAEADPRTTSRYDRARNNLDRHASYVVTAFVAGAA